MSKKLADFVVENRTSSILDDKSQKLKSHDLIGRQRLPIFAWQTIDFCWPILLADKIGNFIDRLTSP